LGFGVSIHGAHHIELKLGERGIFSFISHQSIVRACFKELDRKQRPERGEWEPQTSFEIFGRCPKTPSTNEILEVKIPRPTPDKSTKGILRKVETQRNRRNTIWNSNDQTALEVADCPLQYCAVCYSTYRLSAIVLVDYLQFKIQKCELAEPTLSLGEK
jgi:hypothetical protein